MTDQPPPTSAANPPWATPPAYVAVPWGPLASWGSRVGASLIDSLLSLIGVVPYLAGFALVFAGVPKPAAQDGYPAPDGGYPSPPPASVANVGLIAVGGFLLLLGLALILGIQIWNRAVRQGRTGQSVGKQAMGIALVDERTGGPIGPWMSFVRDLAHFLDGFLYLGYLWPLWDPKRQTFADKVVGTVVVHVPRAG